MLRCRCGTSAKTGTQTLHSEEGHCVNIKNGGARLVQLMCESRVLHGQAVWCNRMQSMGINMRSIQKK